MSRSAHLNIAIRAALRAGEIMRRERTRLYRLKVETKTPGDFVSEVDRACEASIIRCLLDKYPDHAVIAEEGGNRGDSGSEFVWIIDPLDGTANYLHGQPHCCVSIGLRRRGVLEEAVIYDPLREELFTASRGHGALLNDRRIRCSQAGSLQHAMIATGFPASQLPQLDGYLATCRAIMADGHMLRRSGSACLDLAYVACGRLDGFFEAGLKVWDIAAGSLLVREAGGIIKDYDGGDDYEQTGQVVAAPFKLMTGMLRYLQAG